MAKRDSKGRFLPAKTKAKGGHAKKGAAGHKKGKAAGSTAMATTGGQSIRSQAGFAVPGVLVGGLSFLAVRLVTFFGLGVKKDTGERRDKGWVGFLGNAVVLVLGWIALRSFGPTKRYALAWLVGGGIAIALRGVTAAWPDKLENAGLLGTDAAPQLGGGAEVAPGVAGISDINMRGLVNSGSRLVR